MYFFKDLKSYSKTENGLVLYDVKKPYVFDQFLDTETHKTQLKIVQKVPEEFCNQYRVITGNSKDKNALNILEKQELENKIYLFQQTFANLLYARPGNLKSYFQLYPENKDLNIHHLMYEIPWIPWVQRLYPDLHYVYLKSQGSNGLAEPDAMFFNHEITKFVQLKTLTDPNKMNSTLNEFFTKYKATDICIAFCGPYMIVQEHIYDNAKDYVNRKIVNYTRLFINRDELTLDLENDVSLPEALETIKTVGIVEVKEFKDALRLKKSEIKEDINNKTYIGLNAAMDKTPINKIFHQGLNGEIPARNLSAIAHMSKVFAEQNKIVSNNAKPKVNVNGVDTNNCLKPSETKKLDRKIIKAKV